MSRPNPDWVPTHELLEIFLSTEQAHPATRGQQLCVKAHTELCRRIQAPAYIPTPKEDSAPEPSSLESYQLDSLESGTTNSPTRIYTEEELRSRYNAVKEHLIQNSNLQLDSIPMLNSYVKPGAAISVKDLPELIGEIYCAELCLLRDSENKKYSPTPYNRRFVRGWLAAKGFNHYVQ